MNFAKCVRVLIACGAVMVSSSAYAGFIGSRSIAGLDVGDTNRLIVRLSGEPICQGANFVSVNKADPWYNDMLAMALSAYASNKPINVYISGCESEAPRVLRMVQGSVY